MRNQQVYSVTVGNETQQVVTLKEVKALIGDTKVTTKAIMAGEYEGVVTLIDLAEEQDTAEVVEATEEVVEEQSTEEVNHELTNTVEDIALTNTEEDTEEDTEPVAEDTVEDDTEYPEVGYFADEKALKKYIKGISNEALQGWCDLEGAEYKPCDHESINRMRMAMAIKGLHFPDTVAKKGSSKKKSKYADYSTEDLVQMAIDNDVEVRDDKGDMRILRMYTIMALKDAGILEA